MSLIEWKEQYAIGIPAVDTEHRELIALINEVHRRLRAGEEGLTVSDFLGEIFARISAHFALEERVMRERHYDQLPAHKADHERLLDGIRDIMDDYEDRKDFDAAAFAMRLDAWFGEHFRTHDARLHRHLPH